MASKLVVRYTPEQTGGSEKTEELSIEQQEGDTYYLSNGLGDDIRYEADKGKYYLDGELWGTNGTIINKE